MKEYIERSEVVKMLRGECIAKYPSTFTMGLLAAADVVAKAAPAADVVEVVRCKDCKCLMFSDFYGECSKARLGIVRPDDFCSYGERK